jgi:hypothetical protein
VIIFKSLFALCVVIAGAIVMLLRDFRPYGIIFMSMCVYCRSRWPRGLRRRSWPLGYWDRGFEFRSKHGCLSLCCVILCRYRPLQRADHWPK